MNQKLKKRVSIIFAILIGLGIVFFAWRSAYPTASSDPSLKDTEWKNTLSVVPQVVNSGSLATNKNVNATGAIAENLMTKYLNEQGETPTTMSDEDAALFAQSLLDNNTPSSSIKKYTKSSFLVIDTSTSTMSTYEKKLAEAMENFSKENNFNELVVVAQAVDTGDESKLGTLSKSIASYQKLINSLLLMKVPEVSVDLHIYITQSYETILSGVIDMQKIISDPVIGLQGFAKYNKGIDMLSQIVTRFSLETKK